ASGLVAGGMGAAFGKEFVAGDMGGVTYTPERCAYFLEYDPAPTCAQAATEHHFDEVVVYRLGAGVLGLLALGGYAVAGRWRRLSRFVSTVGLLPDGFVATMGTAAFGVAAVALVGNSLGLMIIGGETAGAGQYLSGGVVALAAAAFFLARLHRALLRRTVAESIPGFEPSPGT
ncbi:MAG TPA: hypothetical protein VE760_05615, partial [Acidimicrobiales bacterium]|nr:hypothetical protein [Acidimicrobiales bacterium]